LAKKNEDKLDLLNRKIFTFIDQILSEINKTEDFNIKYFDAVLTLTNKVLNLQV
jgi:5-bromo-4-chloroindolyl phosphate hydrolysis protein